MKRQMLLLTLAVASILMAVSLVFIFDDGKPRFLLGRDGKVELKRNDYYSLPPLSYAFEMREWRVWPARYEELSESAKREFPTSEGWVHSEQKIGNLPWLQISKGDSALTIYFERGDWYVFQSRKLGRLDYYRAWIRSGGELQPQLPTGKR